MRILVVGSAVVLLSTLAPGPHTATAQELKDAASILHDLTLKPAVAPDAAADKAAPGADADEGGVDIHNRPWRGVKPRPTAAKPQASLIVLFASGSADLTGDGRAQLDQVGIALKDARLNGAHFRIEGHTDTKGDAATNQALSERRARAVVSYLVAQHGLDRGRFQAVGMGKQGLAVQTPDQTDEPRNRRVVFVNLDG